MKSPSLGLASPPAGNAAPRPHSFPGLPGQSSTHGRCLLDRPVKPGDDSEVCVNLNAPAPLLDLLLGDEIEGGTGGGIGLVKHQLLVGDVLQGAVYPRGK